MRPFALDLRKGDFALTSHVLKGRRRGGSASDHRPASVMLRRRTCIRRAPARIVPIAPVTRPPLTMLASNLAEKPWASMIASVAPVGPEVASFSRARRPSGLRRRVGGGRRFLVGSAFRHGAARTEMPPPPDCWRIIAWSAALSMAASRRAVPGLALTEGLISKLPGNRPRAKYVQYCQGWQRRRCCGRRYGSPSGSLPIQPHGGITITTADDSYCQSEPRAPPRRYCGPPWRGRDRGGPDRTHLRWVER